jgi:hypothetical protein
MRVIAFLAIVVGLASASLQSESRGDDGKALSSRAASAYPANIINMPVRRHNSPDSSNLIPDKDRSFPSQSSLCTP